MKETHYIYFLLRRGKVVYIGCSRNVDGRLQAHKYAKPHTKVRIMGPYPKDAAFANETRWIKKFRPVYNLGLKATFRKKKDPSEKVIMVGFYIKRKVVERVGGMEQARKLAYNHITELSEIGHL